MKLRYSPKAKRELIQIGLCVASFDAEAATRVVRDIKETVEYVLHFPEMGREQHTLNIRRIVSKSYRYLIYYRHHVHLDMIEVFAIRHSRQSRSYQDN